jgi:hypothetical protein
MWCSSTPESIRTRTTIATCISAALLCIVAALSPSPAHAQAVSRFSLESVVGIDEFGGENVNNRPQIVIDIFAGMRVGDNWQFFVRPWFRLPRPTTPTAPAAPWDKQLYGAGVRYERPGKISTRVEAGYLVSPVGLGLFDVRPDVNPTIAQHLSYLIPMPPFDTTVPVERPLSSTYPLGGLVTLSTNHWDARAAVVNSSPTRPYAVGAVTRPRQTPVFELGGGVTPVVGLRFGGSMAHGKYATRQELTRNPQNVDGRVMTLVGGEGEWAFRYTKISGEMTRVSFETIGPRAIAYEYFIQGLQTLTPRWFVAARNERSSAPPLVNGVGIVVGNRQRFTMVETTGGFRLNREITFRGSYLARKAYTGRQWDNQVGVSAVWARRWW